VDSTIARAHQHAAGARKGGTANAKNRAGLTTSRPTTPLGASGRAELRAAPGRRGWPAPLSIVVTAGQRGDSPQFAVDVWGPTEASAQFARDRVFPAFAATGNDELMAQGPPQAYETFHLVRGR
jgi:hypothetical protein